MHSHYTLPWEKKDAVYTPRSKGSAEFIFPYKWRPVLLTFFQLRSDLFIFTHLQEMGIFQSIILSPGKQFLLLNHGQRQISHSLHVLPQKIFLIVVPLVAKGFTKNIVQILLLEPCPEGMRNFVKPPRWLVLHRGRWSWSSSPSS